MSFAKLGLSSDLLNGLADISLENPTPLQNEVVPTALEGKNVLVKNENADIGAFLIPVLQNILNHGEVKETRILILTPSKERAQKIDELVWAMGYYAQISSAKVAMGGNKEEQKQALYDGAPVIVANPGQLLNILYNTDFRFKNITTVVIDNGHEMENYNLVDKVNSVFKLIDGTPQVLLYSAKFNFATQKLTSDFLNNPVVFGFDEESLSNTARTNNIENKNNDQADNSAIKPQKADANAGEDLSSDSGNKEAEKAGENDNINPEKKLKNLSVSVVLKKDQESSEDNDENGAETERKGKMDKAKSAAEGESAPPVSRKLNQGYINVPPKMKISTLMAHLEKTLNGRAVIFTASKRTANRLFRIILKKNWGVVSIYEGIEKETFDERYNKFAAGEMKVLLVGGISARDLEIENVSQVINYDVPTEADEYRFRAELVKKGKATQIVSLVSKMDKQDMNAIVKDIGHPPTEIPLPVEIVEKKSTRKNKPTKKSTTGKGSKRTAKQDKGNFKPKKRSYKPNLKRELPRPNYDGLSGGRDGESRGMFGWLKKLFK